MPLRRKFPILGDMPAGRRTLAVSALAAAWALQRITRTKSGGSGDVLVSFANLGDQLRTMNVLSRFTIGAQLDVYCNAGTEQAFSLYPMVASTRGYANQGTGALIPAAGKVFTRTAQYARALIPQPFVTQPLALAIAKSVAAKTIYSCPHEGENEKLGAILLSIDSWKRAYENFFEHAFARPATFALPQIHADLRYNDSSSSARIVVHCTTSASSRAVTPNTWKQVFKDIRSFGLDLVILGSRSEETALHDLVDVPGVRFFLGQPLFEVARLLSTSRLFVGVDSSMMNLADAVGVPSVILYLYTSPAVHGPFYSQSFSVVPEHGYRPVGVDPMISWNALERSGHLTASQILDAIEFALSARVR